MARRPARTDRIAHAVRWVVASPRLARALALYVSVLLAAGTAVAAVRSGEGPSAPGPVFELAEAAETRAVPAQPAVSRAAPRPRPHVRARARPRVRPTTTTLVKGWAYWAPRIRQCESSGNYRAQSATTTASGAYQILDSTWQGRFGIRRAGDASPAQQDRAAEELYRAYGTAIWTASAPCWRT